MSPKRTPVVVNLADIVPVAGLQVRERTSAGTIKKYRQALATGADFPPLEVGSCGGALWLLDGYHRKAAFEGRGQGQALVFIREVATLEEARWLAAKANLTHGLPLRASERRNAFIAYMEAGQNREGGRPDGELKSYRAMALDLGGMPFSTLRNWLRQDYPVIFEAMRTKGEDLSARGGLEPTASPSAVAFGVASEGLEAAGAAVVAVTEPHERAALAAKAEALVAAIRWNNGEDLPDERPF